MPSERVQGLSALSFLLLVRELLPVEGGSSSGKDRAGEGLVSAGKRDRQMGGRTGFEADGPGSRLQPAARLWHLEAYPPIVSMQAHLWVAHSGRGGPGCLFQNPSRDEERQEPFRDPTPHCSRIFLDPHSALGSSCHMGNSCSWAACIPIAEAAY